MSSVEFRLCREHFGRKLHYETYVNELMLRRLADLSLQLAQQKFSAQEMKSVAQHYESQNDYAASIMDPVRYEKLVAKLGVENKNTDENKAAYLANLAETPFNSVNDIVASINQLNSKIAKQNAHSSATAVRHPV